MLIKNSDVLGVSLDPFVNLWSDVILLAMKDLKHIDNTIRESAETWFRDENSSFPWVCDSIGLHAGAIRKKMLM